MERIEDFDGILCFGQVDWWYHNRTHFDLQIMRELSREVPVLYVNSLGMKIPSPTEGRMFLTRLKRKAKSFMRGLKRIRNNFAVFSPVNVPGISRNALGKRLLALQVKLALRRCKIRRPLIWVGCPPAYEILQEFPQHLQLYQRTDRYENYSGVDPEYISALDRLLKEESEFTVFCSTLLFEREQEGCRQALYIEHGVDYDYFSGADQAKQPADIADISQPRAVYVGGMDHGVFDPDFFQELARLLPDWSFILVGSVAFGAEWCHELPNVHIMGKRDYSEVAGYMAAADVLFMTWCRNDWIEVCNPVKTKEYLAVGKGVVSTPFYELRKYTGYIRSCETPKKFAQAMRDLKESPPQVDTQRQRVEHITWEVQAKKIWDAIQIAASENRDKNNAE